MTAHELADALLDGLDTDVYVAHDAEGNGISFFGEATVEDSISVGDERVAGPVVVIWPT